MKVCLIEDNRDLGEAIERHLRRDGHAVTWTTDGNDVDDLMATEGFDVLILDLTLPATDGVTILRRLRRNGQDLPVLVTTARAEIDDKVSLLDLGADDYLVKPFDLRELDARLRAVVRRPSGRQSSELVLGDLAIDQGACTAAVAGRAIDLGLREFRLLELLATSAGPGGDARAADVAALRHRGRRFGQCAGASGLPRPAQDRGVDGGGRDRPWSGVSGKGVRGCAALGNRRSAGGSSGSPPRCWRPPRPF
jgi:two-component system, OmpR family, response regulator TctD